MKTKDRIAIHARLFELYRYSQQYADLLDAAGNRAKAQGVRNAGEQVARNHDLDYILKGIV